MCRAWRKVKKNMSRIPTVLVADKISDEGVEGLRANGIKPLLKHSLSGAELTKILAKVDAVVVRSATKITAEALGANPSIKVIGRAGIGVDNIDVSAATEKGIVVLNTPDANATTTAELSIAHIFSLARHLTAANASVLEGRWDRSKYNGMEISNKTVGVVGYGTIGRIVASRCRALSMEVIVHDPFVLDHVIEEDNCRPATLSKLLQASDFVTIHTPGIKETMGLLGAKELARMSKTSYLIQCARGGIVEEKALASALNKGVIAGAAVDVFTEEPMPANHVLRKAKNIVFTPHLGASTKEAQKATGLAIAEQLGVFFKTGEAVNAVNLPRISGDKLEVARPYLPLARGLGKLLVSLCTKRPEILTLELLGQAADLPASIIMAEAVAGVLERRLAIPVNQVNAVALAERQGLKLVSETDHTVSEFATKLRLCLQCGKKSTEVVGTLLGGQQPRIAYMEGIELEAPLTGPVLITTHLDKPGVIAHVAGLLAKHNINITHMHVGSSVKGRNAVAFMRLERMLSDKIVNTIGKVQFVKRVVHLNL